MSLLVILTLPRSIYDLWKRRDIVKDRQAELTRVMADNEKLKKELEEAQTPEFIEKVAREKLGLVKDGETIVLLPQQPLTAENIESSGEVPNEVNWKKWWRLFF